MSQLDRVRRWIIKMTPPGLVRAVRERKWEWRDRRVRSLRAALSPREPLVMYCIGARGGQDALPEYFRRRGLLRTVGFEADAGEAEKLSRQKSFDVVLPCALGDAVATKTLHVTANPGCSSLMQPQKENIEKLCAVPRWFDVVKQVEIKTFRLDGLVAEHRLPPADMIEIDTQGFELPILKGCGDLLDQVATLSLEQRFYSLYEGEPLFAEVNDWLMQRGFHLAMVRRNGYFGNNLVEVNACYFNERLVRSSARAANALTYWKIRYRDDWE